MFNSTIFNRTLVHSYVKGAINFGYCVNRGGVFGHKKGVCNFHTYYLDIRELKYVHTGY